MEILGIAAMRGKGEETGQEAPRILIVDDEAPIRRLLERLLTPKGYRVTLAENAAEARAWFEKQGFHLVLCDVKMPGESGLGLAKYLAEAYPDTAVVMVSAVDDPATARAALEIGAYGYIIKPFEANEILINVANALRRRQLEIENRRHRENLEQMVNERTAQLRESEARYRTLFDGVPVGLYRTTPGGEVQEANQALRQMLGYHVSEDLSAIRSWETYVDPEARVRWLSLMEGEGVARNSEQQMRRRDGTVIWVEENTRAVCDGEGRLLHYEGSMADITKRKHAEEELGHTLKKLRKALDGAIRAMAITVETRDPYTAGHQRRVAALAVAIAEEMGLSPPEVEGVLLAGMIHDIGKISVPAEILSKPTRLTATEFELIKTHAQTGYDILKSIDFPWPIAQMVLQHHEKLDGSGYPLGISGPDMLPGSRILVVADVVEAMASHRPYRPALGIEKALEEISSKKGVWFDPEAVDACFQLIRDKRFSFEK